jgi:NADH-quinone oxidoreductase subunit J
MLLSDTQENPTTYPWRDAVAGLAVFFFLAAGVIWLFVWSGAVPSNQVQFAPPELSSDPLVFTTAAKSFGRLLYTKYLLPLEISGFLLLVALVGVVSISKDSKIQSE